jgi:hypothetical protein
MESNIETPGAEKKRVEHPFRSAVIRGLAVVSPPLLTIVIFFWIGGTVNQYVLRPCTDGLRYVLVWQLADVREDVPKSQVALRPEEVVDPSQCYYKTPDEKYVPLLVYDRVRRDRGVEPLPQTAKGV